MAEQKISILVPVYNVSKYIESCVHSLFSQTYKNLEYIFIDDCSPDDSIVKLKKVLEEYPQRREQVKIIHHSENKGVGIARDTAFRASSGKYIQYIDSDDYIEKEMVGLLFDKIESEGAEIAVCDVIVEQMKGSRIITDRVYGSHDENLKSVIEAKYSLSSLVNKLILSDLFAKCQTIPEGMNYGEDRYLMMQLYFYASRIVKVDKPLYHYVNNTHSISHRVNERHFKNTLLRWKLIEEFYKGHNVYAQYQDIIGFTKIKSKAELLINAKDVTLLKKYSGMFIADEQKYTNSQSSDKKIILLLVRNKMFVLAKLYCEFLKLYNTKIKNLRY